MEIESNLNIPLSRWQKMVNRLFYTRDDSPLDHIGTLGGTDPLLPKALAEEIRRRNIKTKVIHEVGPGNFNFASNLLDNIKNSNYEYHAHDFSTSSHAYVQESLKRFGSRLVFHQRDINKFASQVDSDPLNLIMVELLDDTFTDFYTQYEGVDYMLFVKPTISSEVVLPSKSKYAQKLANDGDFSLHTQRMANNFGTVRDYTAKEIIEIIQSPQNWNSLENIHPVFLNHLKYPKHEFNPISIDDLISVNWKETKPETLKYLNSVLNFYKRQLKNADDKKVIPLPIIGINLLWQLKERKSLNLDIFDYGFGDISDDFSPFVVHNGQITTSVNFPLLVYAAETLGYNVKLEKNREFIYRNLGLKTVPAYYAIKLLPHMTKNKDAVYELFKDPVQEINPDVDVTKDNLLGYRISEAEFNKFVETVIKIGKCSEDYVFHEGSYHLHISK